MAAIVWRSFKKSEQESMMFVMQPESCSTVSFILPKHLTVSIFWDMTLKRSFGDSFQDSTEIIKKTINDNKAKKVEFASKKQKSQAKGIFCRKWCSFFLSFCTCYNSKFLLRWPNCKSARITATLYLTSVTNTRTTFSSQQEDPNHSRQPSYFTRLLELDA